MKRVYSVILPILLLLFSGFMFAGCGGLNVNKSDVDVKIGFNLTEFEYNGKYQTPIVAVFKVNGENVSSKYYEITAVNNKNVGEATATIKLKGKYKGKIVKKFNIVPKKLTITGISFKQKKYEEGNRIVEFSSSSNPVLKGVVEGEDVTLNSTNAGARIKTSNVDAGSRTVECFGFTIEGEDVSNYVLVQYTSSINITKVSQDPVSNEDVSVEVYSNKIIINNLSNIENLEYCITKDNSALVWKNTNIFNDLSENTSYRVYVRRKSSTNYLASSFLEIDVTTPKSSVEVSDIEIDENIAFEKGDIKIEKQDGNNWRISGYLADVSEDQKNYFNYEDYNYFIPLNLKLDYSKSYSTKIYNVLFTVNDGVANVTKSIEWSEDDEQAGFVQLIKGINETMIEAGKFEIMITWGNGDQQTYTFDISELKLPTLVRSSSIKLGNVEFDSKNVKLEESEVYNEFKLSGNVSKMNISQQNAFSYPLYNYFVTLYFENANIDWDEATMTISEGGVKVKEIVLKDAKDSQFGFNLVKGLKLNQQSFKIDIKWNGEDQQSYLFDLKNVVFESLKWVDEDSALEIGGIEFYNSNSVTINKTNEFNKYNVDGVNTLTVEQKSVLNTSKENFVVLFFERVNPDFTTIKYNFGGDDVVVEAKYQRDLGFYVILLFNNSDEMINLNISWDSNSTEQLQFNLI